MKAKVIFFLSFSISLLASCNNYDSLNETDRGKALLGQWSYESITTDSAVDINGDGVFNIDLFNTQEIHQCVKDNLTFFNERAAGEKGVYSVNDNGLACQKNSEFTNLEEDFYELANNSVIQFDNRPEMRIVEMTSSKLVIDTNDNLGGENVVVTITFVKS